MKNVAVYPLNFDDLKRKVLKTFAGPWNLNENLVLKELWRLKFPLYKDNETDILSVSPLSDQVKYIPKFADCQVCWFATAT